MGLAEEFQADLASRAQSKEFQLEQEFRAHLQEQAQGGAIKQGTAKQNVPIGATVGAVGGATAGLLLTGGNPLGAIGGGVLGTAAGELVQQGYEALKDPGAAPQSVGESAARVGEQVLYQAATEGVGRLAGGLIAGRKLAPGIPQSITPKEQQAMTYLTQKGFSPGYMPSEVTEARGLDVLHNIAEFSLFGGGAIKKFRDKRDTEVFADLAQQMINDLGPKMAPDEVGRAVVQAVNRGLEMEKIPIKMEYNMIEAMAAPGYTHVPTRMQVVREQTPITETKKAGEQISVDRTVTQPPLKSEARGQKPYDVGFTTPGESRLEGMNVKTQWTDVQVGERLERLKVMTDTSEMQISGARINLTPLKDELAGAANIAKRAGGMEDKAMGSTMLRFLEEKPDMVSYPVAKQIRTELRVLRDGLSNNPETKNAPAIGLAEKAYASMTKRIESGLREYDPFLADRWTDVNLREASRQATFNNDIVRALVKNADRPGSGHPEAIVDQVFQRNNISTIQNVKNAVDAPTWDTMLSWHWQHVYEKSGADATKMKDAFFGSVSGLGEKEMVSAYGTNRTQQYRELINAMQVAQAKQGDKTGSMFIQLKQPGAVMNLSGVALQATGATLAGIGLSRDDMDASSVVAGATIVLAPPVLAKLMTNPTAAKWIIDGMRIPRQTKEATAMAMRILPLAYPKMSTPEPAPATAMPMTVQPMGNQQ